MKRLLSAVSAAALSAALVLSAAAKEVNPSGSAGGQTQFDAGIEDVKTMLSGGSLPLIIGIAVAAVIVLAAVIIRVKKK